MLLCFGISWRQNNRGEGSTRVKLFGEHWVAGAIGVA